MPLTVKTINVAVILGAGVGVRFGGGSRSVSVPKQFHKVGGRTVFERSVGVFQACDAIDEIALVVQAEYTGFVGEMSRRCGWDKVKRILVGGGARHLSTLAAIRAYESYGIGETGEAMAETGKAGETGGGGCSEKSGVNLIFHDAVRPLVTDRILRGVVGALDRYEAAGVAIPATDTVFLSDDSGLYMSQMPDRRRVFQCQTPQAFRLDVIRRAYELALRDPGFQTTDDCGVVLKYLPGAKIRIVEGERRNIKLTHAEDLPLIESLLRDVPHDV